MFRILVTTSFIVLAFLALALFLPHKDEARSYTPQTTSTQTIGKDKYYFEQPEYFHDNVKIEVVFYPDGKTLSDKIGNERVKAFAIRTRHKCTIHIVDPNVSYEPEYIGHELMHCYFGNWHPTQPNLKLP